MKNGSTRTALAPLSESQWSEVFYLRCRSKRGERLADPERDLLDRAFRLDEKRYGTMEGDVFNATVPFGSTARFGSAAKLKAKRR